MSEHIDYGKPGDPSGCYFPREWRSPGAKIGLGNRDVEAVAEALSVHDWNGTQPPLSRKPKSYGDTYRARAKAALEAALVLGWRPPEPKP